MKPVRTATAAVAAVSLAAVAAAYAGFPSALWITRLQAVPAALRACVSPSGWLDFVPLLTVLAVTLLLGRFYCRAVCPLGIAQSVVSWLVNLLFRRAAPPRRVCTRLPCSRSRLAVNLVFVALFIILPFWVFDPYAIFGRMLTMLLPVGVFGIIIILSAAFGNGRLWCNWICPVGTLFSFLARFSLIRDKVGHGCANCRKCFAKRDAEAPAEKNGESSGASSTRREAIKGMAVLAVTEKLTDGGHAPVSVPGSPERQIEVMPLGARSRAEFELKCTACQLCVVHCPQQILKPTPDLSGYGRPRLDFRDRYCRLVCTRCGEVCPTGAIMKVAPGMREHVHMGRAVYRKDLCVRTTVKDKCTACVRRCPVDAVSIVDGFPAVDEIACVGCGACEHVCPARPSPAIYVEGLENPRIVFPTDEKTLVGEMRLLVEKGSFAVVVARDGRITARERGSGIAPLMKLLDAGKLEDAVVFDKVKAVYASVMSEGARELLAANGVPASGIAMTPFIRNRADTGPCPMDTAVKDISDPVKMVQELRKVIKK